MVALLAGAATGCSSDVSRFDGLFSRSGSDAMTTGSIPRRSYSGGDTVPSQNVGNGWQYAAAAPSYSYGQDTISREPVNASTNGGSGARFATTPMSVERSNLAAPGAAASRDVAIAQPMPQRRAETPGNADTLTTGTVGKAKAGWSTNNAPVVMLRQGESLKTLSNRYGVPEKEILAANGLKKAADAEPGQRIVIPTFSTTDSVARASADGRLKVDGKPPAPERKSEQNVAILPGASNREKQKPDNGNASSNVATAGQGKPGDGTFYEVQPGDSLTRIAGKTGVSIDALKKANGMETASIRIGQKLVIPAGGSAPAPASAAAADKTVTASVPADSKPKDTAAKKPESYQPPVKTVSISEATAKSDVTEEAPESSGIGKYRWPVRGAVIAGYGANVGGNRNDGIDIAVPEGTPVKAAENGVVIYAGSSLKELGNAVLVRHDDGTVTVYGHASELSVQRGQKIQRGQTVATSGMSGNATRPKLHFEVRKNATPVNPMTYLQ